MSTGLFALIQATNSHIQFLQFPHKRLTNAALSANNPTQNAIFGAKLPKGAGSMIRAGILVVKETGQKPPSRVKSIVTYAVC